MGIYEPTAPSAATRPSRFFADAKPRLRKISIACSSWPPASVSALLHSIMPAPVFSLSDFTAAAVISAMIAYALPYSIAERIFLLKSAARRKSAFEAALADFDIRWILLTRGDDGR